MAEKWSDFTDGILNDRSDEINKKYGLNLIDLLSNPGNYTNNLAAKANFDKIRNDIYGYLDQIEDSIKDERDDLNKNLKNCDEVTSKITSFLNDLSKKSNVPIISPANMRYNKDSVDTVYINEFNDSISLLLNKLVSSSTFILDSTDKYDDYSIGEWIFFRDHKNYDVNLLLEGNTALDLDSSRNEINYLFANAEFVIGIEEQPVQNQNTGTTDTKTATENNTELTPNNTNSTNNPKNGVKTGSDGSAKPSGNS